MSDALGPAKLFLFLGDVRGVSGISSIWSKLQSSGLTGTEVGSMEDLEVFRPESSSSKSSSTSVLCADEMLTRSSMRLTEGLMLSHNWESPPHFLTSTLCFVTGLVDLLFPSSLREARAWGASLLILGGNRQPPPPAAPPFPCLVRLMSTLVFGADVSESSELPS